MASQRKINLLPKDEFELTPSGRMIKWAVGVGRWVVVFTELVVICAFLSRFYFDTKLANYFDEIKQKKAMVDSAITFEQNFREIQKKTQVIKGILAKESKPSELLLGLNSLIPLDVSLTEVGINNNKLNLSGYTLSENGLNVFLRGLTSYPQLTSVSLNNVSVKKETAPAINFSISAEIKTPK